jgi:C-terminal processing protease CtpA/Prc
LSDGSTLLLAVEELLTPAGHAIWHKGITPEIKAELPAEAVSSCLLGRPKAHCGRNRLNVLLR